MTDSRLSIPGFVSDGKGNCWRHRHLPSYRRTVPIRSTSACLYSVMHVRLDTTLVVNCVNVCCVNCIAIPVFLYDAYLYLHACVHPKPLLLAARPANTQSLARSATTDSLVHALHHGQSHALFRTCFDDDRIYARRCRYGRFRM